MPYSVTLLCAWALAAPSAAVAPMMASSAVETVVLVRVTFMFTKPLFAALLIVVGLETVATNGLPKSGVRRTAPVWLPVPSRTLRIARRNSAACESYAWGEWGNSW
ncbi:hypothetical protein PPGU16_52500 [Paraburkholderia largidicola]|uniref:Secreted protein n=1 Tax=Paraburkholderia largidicola TaxID=3014751 RepID=A0A7I8BUG2_9BURK|nr:hypothetical protein PPGU16_52500 [Paraburkholderia sp. PGU16]